MTLSKPCWGRVDTCRPTRTVVGGIESEREQYLIHWAIDCVIHVHCGFRSFIVWWNILKKSMLQHASAAVIDEERIHATTAISEDLIRWLELMNPYLGLVMILW